ncbi:agmatinase family protein [Luteibaculum oceani]|uniref:Agmatinase family protein n=1 Tax=Luteibaculum oceani TaxID=1294296 RepID=A0A5C6USD7_9FLAO|nr:agmatinase family protein [Luteibaculum oceani]TXC76243.1 agmatinase family protein [Luteibaculum oceani]
MNNSFDINGVGIPNGQYFGFPFSLDEADLVYLSIPWDATTSYGKGTSHGPEAILEASTQLDFFDPCVPKAWNYKRATIPVDQDIAVKNAEARKWAKMVSDSHCGETPLDADVVEKLTGKVNSACTELNNYVYQEAKRWLNKNKWIGLVGGDHGAPLGLMKAVAEVYPGVGILQIDAHADLRNSYEGFTYSHASIMYNALQLKGIANLTQVGIRDLSPQEAARIDEDGRIRTFFDWDLSEQQYQGKLWSRICEEISRSLPENVYISFDIDGLAPYLSPDTGTPVPGGLTFNQVLYLLYYIVESGKKIVGFDLCEVAPEENGEWNANVGARILYRLSNLLFLSQNFG